MREIEPTTPPFAALVRQAVLACARDEREAFERLYDLVAPRLIRYAETLTRSREDAEDVLQGTLVRVAERTELVAASAVPWAYLIKICRHEAFKLIRRRDAWRAFGDLAALWTVDAPGVEAVESEADVRSALRELPPAQAEVVVLKFWEELTFAEIAAVVAESPNTVASRYRYALQKLARHLQPWGTEVRHG